MQNDSKLGLLAGVAGVVVAAVLLMQQPSATPPPENAKHTPLPAATPVKVPPAAPSTPVASRSRPEIEAKTASRPARADDDD
jgi:hypothetical protein